MDTAATAPAVRLMYWPNEPAHLRGEFSQVGGRLGFEALAVDGTISALEIFSYRHVRAEHPSAAAFEAIAREAIERFAPDILFVQHLFGTDIGEDFWQRLQRDRPALTLIYHEGDPYDRLVKRIDASTKGILRHADLVLACGLGSLADILGEVGGKPVELKPHSFPRSRFALLEPGSVEKTCDVAMIGNSGRRRHLKFLYVPGGRRRARFAAGMSTAFGQRFALYGAGWSHLAASRGRLPFFEQERAIHSARFTANWDHFDHIAYYFSDRLPISLAAGIPHVTSWHPGYDHYLRDVPGLYACHTIEEAIDTCRWLAGRPDRQLVEEGMAGRDWVFRNLESDVVHRRAFEQSLRVHLARMADGSAAQRTEDFA